MGFLVLAEPLVHLFRVLTLQFLDRPIPNAPQVFSDFVTYPRNPLEFTQNRLFTISVFLFLHY